MTTLSATALSSAMEHAFQAAGLSPLADGSYFDNILTLAELDELATKTTQLHQQTQP